MWAAEGFQRYLAHNFNRYDGVNANERGLYDVTKRGESDKKLQANEMKAAVNDYYRVLYANDEIYTNKFDHFDWNGTLSDAAWISWDSLNYKGNDITYDDVTEDPKAFAKVAKQWFGDEHCYTFSDAEIAIDTTFIKELREPEVYDVLESKLINPEERDMINQRVKKTAQKIDVILPCSFDDKFRQKMNEEFPETKEMTDIQRKQFIQVLIASKIELIEKRKPGIADIIFNHGNLTIILRNTSENYSAHTDYKNFIGINLHNNLKNISGSITHELGHYIYNNKKQYALNDTEISRNKKLSSPKKFLERKTNEIQSGLEKERVFLLQALRQRKESLEKIRKKSYAKKNKDINDMKTYIQSAQTALTEVDSIIKKAPWKTDAWKNNILANMKTKTSYSQTNEEEYFCECFKWYYNEPEFLKLYSPEMFELFKEKGF